MLTLWALLTQQPCRHLTLSQWEKQIMDFIERIFGISPDGGSGSLELMLFLIPIAGIAIAVLWRRSSKQQKD